MSMTSASKNARLDPVINTIMNIKIPSMADIIAKLKATTSTIMDKVRKGMLTRATTATAQQKSMDWFFKTIRASENEFRKGSFSVRDHPFIGGMFYFIYDAKHKATLPYWDKFPLVIPIETYSDGFLGLNLHYINPILRAKLLDILIQKYTRSSTSKTYMAVTYRILKSVAAMKMYEPCVHRYLTDHMKSRVVMVTADMWEEAAFLPTARWVGATNQQVWADSKRRI